MSTTEQEPRKIRHTITGVVVSATADKTVRVLVERRVKHRLYGKIMRRRNHILAHDAENKYAVGDEIVIESCRPISKNKAYKVVGKAQSKSS